jgi:hypothetical protein
LLKSICNLAMAGSLCVLSVFQITAADPSFLSTLNTIATISTTVPMNGDMNPYGVAVVPVSMGSLIQGNILVSNFNNSGNLQGIGTTIVQISPGGTLTLFAQINAAAVPGSCPGGIGLTTALVALRSGFVIVGSLPTSDGTSATAQAGCLIVLNSSGTPVSTISGNGINGPWDMTAVDSTTSAILFVTNVLNGTVAGNGNVVSKGSVLRIALSIPSGGTPAATSFVPIATKFDQRTDPAALVIGPTGVSIENDVLYVADTLNSRIAAIPFALERTTDAGSGITVAQGRNLNQPLGMALAPNGDILTVNGGDGLLVETDPDGRQVGTRFVDVSFSGNGAGTLFGLAVAPSGTGIYLVDDGNNTLNILKQ